MNLESSHSPENGKYMPQLLGLRDVMEAARLGGASELHDDMALLEDIRSPYQFDGASGYLRLLEKIRRDYDGHEQVDAALSYAIVAMEGDARDEAQFYKEAAASLSAKYQDALYIREKDDIKKVEVMSFDESGNGMTIQTLEGTHHSTRSAEILIDVAQLSTESREGIERYRASHEIPYATPEV